MTTIQDYRTISRNTDRYNAMIRNRADVKAQIAYFQANIGKIKTVDDFMKDDKIYRFVMEAFDLGSQTYAKGLIRKVLEQGVTDTDSLANRMSDKKFKEMATVLGFKEADGKTLQEPKIVNAIVDRFVEVKLEEQADQQNPAVRLALYFQRKAGGITNWYQVMADRALQKVVFTAFGWPDQMATQNLDTVVNKMKAKFNIADFKDADKVKTFLDKFSAMYDMTNNTSLDGTTSSTTNPYAAMDVLTRDSKASIISIDPSVLTALVNAKRF
jgi:hypothetical protein